MITASTANFLNLYLNPGIMSNVSKALLLSNFIGYTKCADDLDDLVDRLIIDGTMSTALQPNADVIVTENLKELLTVLGVTTIDDVNSNTLLIMLDVIVRLKTLDPDLYGEYKEILYNDESNEDIFITVLTHVLDLDNVENLYEAIVEVDDDLITTLDNLMMGDVDYNEVILVTYKNRLLKLLGIPNVYGLPVSAIHTIDDDITVVLNNYKSLLTSEDVVDVINFSLVMIFIHGDISPMDFYFNTLIHILPSDLKDTVTTAIVDKYNEVKEEAEVLRKGYLNETT